MDRKELDEFQVAIAEAKAVLIEVDKRIKDARAKKKSTSSSSNTSAIDGEMVGDIIEGIGVLVMELLSSIGDAS
ncbi:MAG: hypothetical protein HYW78_01375 [Parcubacteria group bacterium]|nr:hypothetical protein [Parcubacteria group bacterium]